MKLHILRTFAIIIVGGAALILTNDTPSNAQTEILPAAIKTGTDLNVWSSNGPNESVERVVVDPINPNIIFAIFGQLGVFKSINSGASWFASNEGLGDSSVGWLAIDSRNPNTLYATTDNGVFKTTNGGANWSRTNFPAWVVAVAPGNSSIIYAITGTNFLVTANGGETWNTRPYPAPDLIYTIPFVVDPQNPNVIYTFVTDGDFFIGLFKSMDGGVSWTRLYYAGNGLTVATSALKIDSGNPNNIYAATYFGVYKSADGGVSWTLRGSLGNSWAVAIDPLNPGTLYAGAYNAGVYKSTNDGATWSAFNNGLTNLLVRDLAIDRSGRFLHAATSTGVFDVRLRADAIAPAGQKADFDGDGRSDISVFRPSDRVWYLNQSTAGFSATQFGLSTDELAPADFDGDGKSDIAVYRDGLWYWLNSSNGNFNAFQFGLTDDIPVPADFTGDGRAELVVYRSGVWFTWNLANSQFNAVQFGIATDKPVVGDYDGDGRADYAVYRNGIWYLLQSTQGFTAIQFGISTDKLVPADYDGDGKTDLAVYRDGIWHLLKSSQGYTAFQFGIASDIPAPADYDGDGKADLAVYRDGTWYLLQSTNGISIQQFGLSNDKPVPSAYSP